MLANQNKEVQKSKKTGCYNIIILNISIPHFNEILIKKSFLLLKTIY